MTGVHFDHVGDVAFLRTDGTATVDEVRRLLVRALAQVIGDADGTRFEVHTPIADATARQALHRAGFSFEGVRKGARRNPDGTLLDLAQYARLADDPAQIEFTAVMNAVLPRKRLIAHVLIADAQGCLCVLETTFKSDWELPGGIVEAGESPREAAIRECVEELGVTISPAEPLVIDWLAPHRGWEDAVELIFAAPTMDEQTKRTLVPDSREIRAVHWLPLADALPHFAPFARGRLEAAVAALADGRTRYLERGTAGS